MKQMVAVLLTSAALGWGQSQSASSGASSRAVPLPLSGSSNIGTVSASQTSLQVNGSYAGSVANGDIPAGPIRLTIADAVKRALTANLGPISANDAARAARAQRLQALSAMLPNIAANASDTVTQVNLAAFGFQFKLPANSGFSIPTVVGPYNYSNLQGTLSQSIFDQVQRRNWQAAKATEMAATLSARDAHDVVVLAVGGSYLQAVATAARVISQKAQVDNAQAIFNQATVRKAAGTNARIDVTRSQVELQTEQQKLSSLSADYRKQVIALARLIGFSQDREIDLADALDSNPAAMPDTAQAIQAAFNHRSDLQAMATQVKAGELALSAAHAERLPSASISGNYGVIGPNPSKTHGAFAVTGTVTVPIWQGGRTSADIEQAQATLHQRQAELADERGRVEQGVRDSLIELETAMGQVKVADSNRGLAAETLAQARDRFAAGVATTLEVVQAQQQVAGAESDYISSLFSVNLARLSLAREIGMTETGLLHTAGSDK